MYIFVTFLFVLWLFILKSIYPLSHFLLIYPNPLSVEAKWKNISNWKFIISIKWMGVFIIKSFLLYFLFFFPSSPSLLPFRPSFIHLDLINVTKTEGSRYEGSVTFYRGHSVCVRTMVNPLFSSYGLWG